MTKSNAYTRALSPENVIAFAGTLGVPEERIFETSAETGEGVKNLFEAVARCCSKNMKEKDKKGIMLEGGGQQRTGGCGC